MTMTRDEWLAEGERRFGTDVKQWRFVCPVCKTEQGIEDFLRVTDLEKEKIATVIGFSCIGRWARGGCTNAGLMGDTLVSTNDDAMGCNYAGGGFIRCNPVVVEHDGEEHRVFAFAGEPMDGAEDTAA